MEDREAQQFKVTAEKGHVSISQFVFGKNEDSEIIVHPDQVDLLCRWLKEAADESGKGA